MELATDYHRHYIPCISCARMTDLHDAISRAPSQCGLFRSGNGNEVCAARTWILFCSSVHLDAGHAIVRFTFRGQEYFTRYI